MSDITNASTRLPPRSVTKTSTSGTSTAAVAIGVDGWVTFVAQTEKCWIVFGASDVAAADANDFPIPVDGKEEWYCPPAVTHFRVIATSSGALHWCLSS